jgi:hypothetical protein
MILVKGTPIRIPSKESVRREESRTSKTPSHRTGMKSIMMD